ncbi:Late embryogenesis abundant protein, LEA_2 subgroup [Dillenia turbinata]|uniref:Late embryogenesis abundant protein, LEA_2 subgroup n=1 Tax=Dillenia turbinata TaxID=194707 RepID=A0AAN8V0E3_9MAGN
MFQGQGSVRPPPPYRHDIPRYHSYSKRRSGCSCFGCLSCCCCFIFSFILITAALSAFFYFYFEPKAPRYNVTNFNVLEFKTQPDLSLYTEFVVSLMADNPNKNIGFIYGKDSSIVVSYSDSTLCSGQLPAFHQGPSNVTMMDVILKGKSTFGSGLQQALMENRNSGRVPLHVEVKVPVIMVVADFQSKQIDVVVNCSLIVSNLTPGKKANILDTTYYEGMIIERTYIDLN